MSLISTNIPNLVNGVSQQPYALRLASQCEEQINGHSSVVEGLRKRPGTEHIARIPGVSGNAFIHTIVRDSFEKYIVVIQHESLRVFDLEGNEKTVNFPHGRLYLSSIDPASSFRCVTVADYTFVLNTKRVVTRLPTGVPTRPFEALVWVKQGSYGARYRLEVGEASYEHVTPEGNDPTHSFHIATNIIAGMLRDGISQHLGDGWYIHQYGSTLHIRKTDGSYFHIRAEDSLGDHGLGVITSKVQSFSDLPARAVDGFTVEVVGDQSSAFDNYYVRYETDGTPANSGVWKETLKGGEHYALNPSTMPHALVRKADGTFSFEAIDWAKREVGDLESNPFPSFTDRRINDIFFYRNRLGFVSDESIVFSRAGDYFNFFIGTATTVLDDDPIDIGVNHTKVSILRHAIPFNETLLLFSDKTQFQLGSAEILTPDTVSVNQTTEYECSLRARPVGVGRYVYFAVNRGTYSGLREYYVDGETETEEAQEITGHVPKYIPGGIFKIAASSSEDMLAVLSENAPNEVFVYKFYWNGSEKLQSSWSRWRFGPSDKILNCDFIESHLYLLIERADGVHLEVMNLEPGSVEDNWDIHVHLDSKVDEHSVLNIQFMENNPALKDDNQTLIELPYKIGDEDLIQVVCGPGGDLDEGCIFKDYLIDNTGTNTVLVMDGDWRNQPFFIGKPYEFRYRFSPFVIKEEAVGGGQMTVGEGRIQLRRVSLLYDKSGYFRVEVTPYRRDTYRYTFSGRVLGSGNNRVGRVSIEQGTFRFPVSAKNDQVTIEILNDTFLPCCFLSAEWEAFYSIRSRRL